MSRTLTQGKKRGLQAVSDERGVIAALAIDQRSALKNLMAKAMGAASDAVPTEKLVEFKEAVSRVLTPHASAILLDPEYGLPAAKRRAANCGLLLAYEKTGYDKAIRGRLPRLLDHWSARRLLAAGADCVKVLLYYSTTSSTEINDSKHAFVERIGAECRGLDVPFFLELVSYGEGLDDKSAESAGIKPDVVTRSMREFSKAEYGVDVLKVGVPVNMAFVEGSPAAKGEILYSKTQALDYYKQASEAASVPFIYLSQGVENETFQYALELAAEAGARFSGVLCGRATWADGCGVFIKQGAAALEDWLSHVGAQNIRNVNAHLKAAHSCLAE